MNYSNKYFVAAKHDQSGRDTEWFGDIVFIKDIGPYKSGDKYPFGFISVDIGENKLHIEMNTEIETSGECHLTYTTDLI
jgi:hypothetical protein